MIFQTFSRFKTNRSLGALFIWVYTLQIGPSLSPNCCATPSTWIKAKELDGNMICAGQRPCRRRTAGARLAQVRARPRERPARPAAAWGGPTTEAAAAVAAACEQLRRPQAVGGGAVEQRRGPREKAKAEAVAHLACPAKEPSSETWRRWSFTRRPWWTREREGAKGERKNERALARSSLLNVALSLGEVAHRWGARRPRGVARRCTVGHDAAFAEGVQKLKKQILPQTYKLKPIFRTSLTPKPRRFGKNSVNKSCRSTYQLQLLLKLQSLIRLG
jgi:hypothetical protein